MIITLSNSFSLVSEDYEQHSQTPTLYLASFLFLLLHSSQPLNATVLCPNLHLLNWFHDVTV